MEDLKVLSSIVTKNKLKQIELLPSAGKNSSKILELYNGIINNEWKEEEEAADYFYGQSQHKSANFNRLKRKLKDRLINSLFLIDINQPSYTTIHQAYHKCFKNLSAIRILLGQYARKPAINIAEQTLKHAIHFEFTDVILELSKQLRFHYGTISGDRKKYYHYNKIVNDYSQILLAELKAEEYFTDLIIEFANSRGSQLELVEKAKKYYNELRNLTKEFHSYRFNFISFTLFVARFEIANDYENTKNISKEALNYFQSKKHLASTSVIWNFQFKILSSCIYLRQFEEAQIAAKNCLKSTTEGSRNWFLTLDYYMLLYFHSESFQDAFDIYNKAVHHPSFSQQQKNISEHWRVYEAFIFYFILIKKIKPNPDSPLKKFRVSKFLNEVPTYTKDKRGTNISILILHVLFLLQQRKYDQIIDRMESLKTYTHRYLRKDDTFRSNCFIKMLLTLPAASFHKNGVIRKAKKFKDKLESVPLEMANQNAEIEIVPYEKLWEYVVESLDTKFH